MFRKHLYSKPLQFFIAALLSGILLTLSVQTGSTDTAHAQDSQPPATSAPVETDQPPAQPPDQSPLRSLFSQQTNPPPKELPAKVADQVGPPPSAVVLQQQALFEIQSGVGSFSPELRAGVISERLLDFAQDTETPLSELRIVEDASNKTTNIAARDKVILMVLDSDAIAIGKTRTELANDYLETINEAVTEYRKSYSVRNILLGVLYTALLTLLLLVAFTLINRLIAKQNARLQTGENRPRGFRAFGAELVPAARLANFIAEILKAVRLLAFAILFAFYLERVLSFFPWTRGISSVILAYFQIGLLSFGRRFVAYLPNLFFLGMTLLITNYLLKLTRFVFIEIRRGAITIPGFYPEWSKPTYNLIRFAVIAFALTIAYPYLPGSNTPAFRSVSLFVGVLFSLGSSGAVANFVSGIILTYSRAFVVGDRVQISETTGDVIEKTLLVTRINTIKNVIVTIPNSMVLGSHIINYSGSVRDKNTPPLILNTTITLGYDVPWRLVHEVLISAATATAEIIEDPAPFVLQTSLDDFYVSYQINAYTRQPGIMAKTYSALYQNLQDKCNEAGIEILSPHYAAARDGNQLTVPPEYIPKGYEAPSFRLSSLFNTNRENS